jgi:hypothetical protein
VNVSSKNSKLQKKEKPKFQDYSSHDFDEAHNFDDAHDFNDARDFHDPPVNDSFIDTRRKLQNESDLKQHHSGRYSGPEFSFTPKNTGNSGTLFENDIPLPSPSPGKSGIILILT